MRIFIIDLMLIFSNRLNKLLQTFHWNNIKQPTSLFKPHTQMNSIADTHFKGIAGVVRDEQRNIYKDILQKASRELLDLQYQLTSVVRAQSS